MPSASRKVKELLLLLLAQLRLVHHLACTLDQLPALPF
jgi:hypothetical protein